MAKWDWKRVLYAGLLGIGIAFFGGGTLGATLAQPTPMAWVGVAAFLLYGGGGIYAGYCFAASAARARTIKSLSRDKSPTGSFSNRVLLGSWCAGGITWYLAGIIIWYVTFWDSWSEALIVGGGAAVIALTGTFALAMMIRDEWERAVAEMRQWLDEEMIRMIDVEKELMAGLEDWRSRRGT